MQREVLGLLHGQAHLILGARKGSPHREDAIVGFAEIQHEGKVFMSQAKIDFENFVATTGITPIDRGVRAKWITALRSGEWGQTLGALRCIEWEAVSDGDGHVEAIVKDDSFCCLGVLCALETRLDDPEDIIVVEAGDGECGKWETGVDAYDANDTDMPWLGAVYGVSDKQSMVLGSYLASMNDTGSTFAEIADWVEANL